jgi:hypothetical protein
MTSKSTTSTNPTTTTTFITNYLNSPHMLQLDDGGMDPNNLVQFEDLSKRSNLMHRFPKLQTQNDPESDTHAYVSFIQRQAGLVHIANGETSGMPKELFSRDQFHDWLALSRKRGHLAAMMTSSSSQPQSQQQQQRPPQPQPSSNTTTTTYSFHQPLTSSSTSNIPLPSSSSPPLSTSSIIRPMTSTQQPQQNVGNSTTANTTDSSKLVIKVKVPLQQQQQSSSSQLPPLPPGLPPLPPYPPPSQQQQHQSLSVNTTNTSATNYSNNNRQPFPPLPPGPAPLMTPPLPFGSPPLLQQQQQFYQQQQPTNYSDTESMDSITKDGGGGGDDDDLDEVGIDFDEDRSLTMMKRLLEKKIDYLINFKKWYKHLKGYVHQNRIRLGLKNGNPFIIAAGTGSSNNNNNASSSSGVGGDNDEVRDLTTLQKRIKAGKYLSVEGFEHDAKKFISYILNMSHDVPGLSDMAQQIANEMESILLMLNPWRRQTANPNSTTSSLDDD